MKNGCFADNLQEPDFFILPNTFMICFHIRNNNKQGGIYSGVNVDEPKNWVSQSAILNM